MHERPFKTQARSNRRTATAKESGRLPSANWRATAVRSRPALQTVTRYSALRCCPTKSHAAQYALPMAPQRVAQTRTAPHSLLHLTPALSHGVLAKCECRIAPAALTG